MAALHHATEAGSTAAKATTATAAPTYWMSPEPTMKSCGGTRSARAIYWAGVKTSAAEFMQ